MISVLLAAASSELAAAAEYYESRQSGLGGEFIAAFNDAVQLLLTHSRAGQLLPESDHELREFPLARFPFQLIYLLRRDELVIVAIAHNRRRPFYWNSRVQEASAMYRLAA